MATSYGVHDHGRCLIRLFPGWLHHLSCPSRRKIFGIHRLDRRRLFPDTGFARTACLCDVASGDFDAYSSVSAPMGPAQANRTLDDPNLDLRFCDRCARLFNALQVVSPGDVMRTILPRRRDDCRVAMRSLALDGYLMFDLAVRCFAHEKTYGDYCDVQ